MINFNNLDAKELASAGIVFERKEDADRFIEIIIDDQETRIVAEISRMLPESKLSEFEHIEDMDEAVAWLEINIPLYRDIVFRIRKDIEDELLQYKTQIPGTKHNSKNAKADNYEHMKDCATESE